MKGCFAALQAAVTKDIESFLANPAGAWKIRTDATSFATGAVLTQQQAPRERTFYSDFNTVFLMCLSCCLLLV